MELNKTRTSLKKNKLILYSVSSYSSVCQHCQAMKLGKQFGIKLLLQSQGEKNRSSCIYRTKTLLTPRLPQSLTSWTTPACHAQAAAATARSKKGEERLAAVWHFGNAGGGFLDSFPSTEMSAHKDEAIIQLSVLLLSFVPLRSLPGPKPVSSAKCWRAKGIQAVPFQLLSSQVFSHSHFCLKNKHRVAIQIQFSLFLKSRCYRCVSFQVCLLHTNR